MGSLGFVVQDLVQFANRKQAQKFLLLKLKAAQLPLYTVSTMLGDPKLVGLLNRALPLESRNVLSAQVSDAAADVRKRLLTNDRDTFYTVLVDESQDRFARKPVVMVLLCYCDAG